MATSSNKLIPVIAVAGLLIVGTVLFKQFTGPSPVKAGPDLAAVPGPAALPKTAGADNDTPAETLRTVATSNEDLRKDVGKVIQRNNDLIEENKRLKQQLGGGAAGAAAAATAAVTSPAPVASSPALAREPGLMDSVGSVVDGAGRVADQFALSLPGRIGGSGPASTTGKATASAGSTAAPGVVSPGMPLDDSAPGEVRYAVMAPMGYAAQTDQPRGGGRGGVATTRYIRTMTPEGSVGAATGPATAAAKAASAKPADIPFFTIPENATLAGVTAMTSIIGRVPIDGRVTDPMQFKAVIGRENMAANGFDLPGDLAGMIVTGIAIGDMALSCNEGKVRSVTFIFNDGTVRTVSSRNRNSGVINRGAGSSGTGGDLGFISDEHGNPCIPGKFVTNAPAYLTDIVGLKSLSVAGQAYADAQRTTSSNSNGTFTSATTGSAGDYALGQAVAGGTDEVVRWMMQRLKNSFDAVIIPSGQQMVIHLDQEIQIDKVANARKLVYRQQANTSRGDRYGLE